MTHTPSEAAAKPAETGQSIFRRLGSGLLLFAVVFCGLLSASWSYVLPRLTRVQLQGRTVELASVIPYEQELRRELEQVESKRNAIVLPVKDEDFEFAKRKALCYPLPQDVSAIFDEAALPLGEDVVAFFGLSLDERGTVRLEGDVRNVGPRSMTVLAQYVEALEALPVVSSVEPPAFVRQDDPVIGPHSPFTLTLTLRADALCPARP